MQMQELRHVALVDYRRVKMAKKLSLEDSFEALDEIVDRLQSGELTLEESFQKYEEGMKLIVNCNQAIDKVEKKLIVIGETQEEAADE